MPKLLTWREEWSLHIDVIDQDHRALVNQVADICLRFCPEAHAGPVHQAAPGQPTLLDALLELGNQVRAHFRREETFMHAIGYERVAEHEQEHAVLMAEYKQMIRGWRDAGKTVFSDVAQEAVRHWLLDHVLGADRSFADAYFRLCGQETPDAKAD